MKIISALCMTALLAMPTSAQPSSPILKLDVDIGLGATAGGGEPRDVPGALSFGAVVTTPLRLQPESRVVAGVGVHGHWPIDHGTSCIVRIGSTGCTPAYPLFTIVAALVGREYGDPRSAGGSRLMIGPAVFRTDEQQTLFGLQGRADVTVLRLGHLALRLWTQVGTASPLRSDRYVIWSLGTGLRLQ